MGLVSGVVCLTFKTCSIATAIDTLSEGIAPASQRRSIVMGRWTSCM